MYALHPLLMEVTDEKVTLLTRFLRGIWWFVDWEGNLSQLTGGLLIHTLHGTTGVGERVHSRV